MSEISRRGMLTGIAAGFAASLPVFHAGCTDAGKEEPKVSEAPKLTIYKNEHFYDAEGKFDAAKAKAAYIELMEYHKFPILPAFKEGPDFWQLDFNLGKFAEIGMGGIFYINDERDDYLLHDIWLLPGQSIPEHYHLKLDPVEAKEGVEAKPGVAAKMEAWLVRHGSAYFFSEGEESPECAKVMPPSHTECAKARNVVLKEAGGLVKLEVAESRHFMKAGPEGAIVTEVATYHSMDALRFSHPDAKV